MIEKVFGQPQVYVVYVRTIKKGIIRRIDSVHATFALANERIRTIKVASDELANLSAHRLQGLEREK